MPAISGAVKRKLSKIEDPVSVSPRTNPAWSNLCTRCAELRLEDVLSGIKTPIACSVKIADVGQYYRHHWVYGCGLCHMLSASRIPVNEIWESPQDRQGADELHVFNLYEDLSCISKYGVGNSIFRRGISFPHSPLYLAVIPTGFCRSNNKVRIEYGKKNGFTAIHRRDTPKPQSYAPQIVSSLFNLSLARDWLQYCKEHHIPLCLLENDATAELHLIDCYSLEVTPAPKEVEYTALSYVWGESSTQDDGLDSTMTSGLKGRRLPSPAPAVITDAISVTIGLGFRYLWVDRYCIDQGSPSKHQQINQMDSIYKNAELTIVAAAGEGPEYGLPGIGSRTRCGQQTCTIGNFDIISTMRHPHTVIKLSKWFSRAWTFQEATLSRRNLVFMDDQVYFECKAMNCHESLSSNLDILHVQDKSHFKDVLQNGIFGRTDKQKFGHFDERFVTSGHNLVQYMGLVEQYTARDLTYDTDSLNAFTGIIRKFETARVALHQIWGVPFCGGESEKETCDFFVSGLAWKHQTKNSNDHNHPRRRKGFPSWSWAGWAGEVNYGSKDTNWYGVQSLKSEVELLCLDTAGGERITIPAYIDQAKTFEANAPSVIHIRARTLPDSAFSCDTSADPPRLQVFRYPAKLALSTGPWDVPNFYQSLLNSYQRLCIYLGRAGLWSFILVLEAQDDCWSRIGLISVFEETPWGFCRAWKKSKMKPGDRLFERPVFSSRDVGEEAISLRIK